jgi:hypothetical protein
MGRPNYIRATGERIARLLQAWMPRVFLSQEMSEGSYGVTYLESKKVSSSVHVPRRRSKTEKGLSRTLAHEITIAILLRIDSNTPTVIQSAELDVNPLRMQAESGVTGVNCR